MHIVVDKGKDGNGKSFSLLKAADNFLLLKIIGVLGLMTVVLVFSRGWLETLLTIGFITLGAMIAASLMLSGNIITIKFEQRRERIAAKSSSAQR